MNKATQDKQPLEVIGNSSLHEAVIYPQENLTKVMSLLAAGADVNIRNKDGQTPLHMVTHYKIAQLLIAAGADVNARDASVFDATPLIRPIVLRCVPVVQLLLQAGADVHVVTENNGETPLHYALTGIDKLNYAIIEQLLYAGADINAQSLDGSTPLHYFFSRVGQHKPCKNYVRILDILLRAGADFSVKNNEGIAPLDYARNLDPHMWNQIKRYLR